jgi:hypothetical protein
VRRDIAAAIQDEVLRGLNTAPPRGTESGGLLLGHRQGSTIRVEDVAPVPCEHRFGTYLRLSQADRRSLAELLIRLGGPAAAGREVLGLYRSHMRPEFFLDAEDLRLMTEFFPEPARVLLLIKPDRWQRSTADFFFWGRGALHQTHHLAAFPFAKEGLFDAEEIPKQASAPAAKAPGAVRPSSHFWGWGALAAVTAIASGTFVYQSYGPNGGVATHSGVPVPPAVETAAPATSPAAAPPPGAATAPPSAPASAGSATPVPQQELPTRGATATVPPQAAGPQVPAAPGTPQPAPEAPADQLISALLGRWSAAMLAGNGASIARCYTSPIGWYYGQRNATPEDLNRRLEYLRGRYGRLAVHNVDRIAITPTGPTTAFATFVSYWETTGAKKLACEEQERMTFVRTPDGWRIASEERPRILWTHTGE